MKVKIFLNNHIFYLNLFHNKLQLISADNEKSNLDPDSFEAATVHITSQLLQVKSSYYR